MKRILAIILCLCLVLGLCACGGKTENPDEQGETSNNGAQTSGDVSNGGSNVDSNGEQTGNQPSNDKTLINLENAGVILCFGDSITEGMQVDKANNYPSILQKNLGEQIKVINGGVSGEDSNTIMSRANAIEFTTAKDIIFSAGQSEVELDARFFMTADGGEIRYRYGKTGNELSSKNVIIDGKAYTLTGKGEDKYSISRQDSSAALTIKKGAKAKFDYGSVYDKVYCTIVLMGANDSNLTADQLIERYKKIAATSERFIALIPHYGADNTEKFEAAFGNATVNLREYCKEEVWSAYNLEKTSKDDYYISGGNLSAKFVLGGKKGDCHLSELGYKILGDLVYKKGVELGYWN